MIHGPERRARETKGPEFHSLWVISMLYGAIIGRRRPFSHSIIRPPSRTELAGIVWRYLLSTDRLFAVVLRGALNLFDTSAFIGTLSDTWLTVPCAIRL